MIEMGKQEIDNGKGLFKLMSFYQRGKYGFSNLDRFDFGSYLMQLFYNYTAHYLSKGIISGYPARYESEYEWFAVLFAIHEGASVYDDQPSYFLETGHQSDPRVLLAKELIIENWDALWE